MTTEQRTSDEDTIRAARETIDRLSTENSNLTRRVRAAELAMEGAIRERETALRQVHEARQHVQRIRQGIIDEAERRDWCDEVNGFLRGVGLDPWETTFKVTFPATTVTITASCAEQKDHSEIIDQAREMITDDWYAHVGEPTVAET